jgi:hypothetical protein
MEKEKKPKSKKWLIAIILVVIIVIALGLYFNIFSIPTGLVAGTETMTGSPETPTNEPPKFTVTGNEIIAKEVTENLPYYEPVDLESGKYSIQVITDKPVWIRLYDQLHFDEWEKDGKHGKVVIGTNLNEEDKTDNFDTIFFVSQGNGGKHYLLILGNEKTSIKFKITQIQKI